MLPNVRAIVLAGLGLLISWSATPAAGSPVSDDVGSSPSGVFLDLGAAPDHAIAAEGIGAGIQATRPKTASFEIDYQGFPTAAREAFDAAADIWAGYLVSSVPIRIDARWEPLTEHVLGQHVQRFAAWDPDLDSKLPLKGVLYPYSLAQAIGGKRTNLRADTTITLNSTSDWYMGTDGRPGKNQVDLMTVAMHEIGGSLGMTSALDLAGGQAVLNAEFPAIYDTFLVSSTGTPLLSLMKADRRSAAAAMTGGWLYFRSKTVQDTVASAGVRVFSPGAYAHGNSLIHLNPDEYDWPGDNSLMTPGIYDGVASHDPGPIALAILHDLGWEISGLGRPARVATSVVPSPAIAGSPLAGVVSLRVLDPVGVLVASDVDTVVTLNYRYGGTVEFGCSTPAAQQVVGGIANYAGCSTRGSGFMYLVGRAPDLVPGASNIAFVAVTRRTVPSISSAVTPPWRRWCRSPLTGSAPGRGRGLPPPASSGPWRGRRARRGI